jgi:hypothetical protein
VPADLSIADPRARDQLGTHSRLSAAFHQLEDQAGARTAGTLLARKRPLLVPVPDPVVVCALGWDGDPWGGALDAFADGSLVRQIAAARRAADLVSTGDLRALHVVVWMRHHRDHLASRCPGLRLTRR